MPSCLLLPCRVLEQNTSCSLHLPSCIFFFSQKKFQSRSLVHQFHVEPLLTYLEHGVFEHGEGGDSESHRGLEGAAL